MLQIAQAPKGLPEIDPNSLKSSVTRKEVNARHPDWKENKDVWLNVHLLYEGGDAIRREAGRFLMERPKEDHAVYQYRLAQFCYENNLGTGLGWHEAEMFKQPPAIDIKLGDANGKPTEAEVSKDQQDFYARFQKDCDRAGTCLVDKFRAVMTHLLLYGHSWVLTDMPEQETPLDSLADQKAQRLLDPYVSVIEPLDVINWDTDRYGNVTWAVIYTKTAERSFLGPQVVRERWYHFDRQMYRVYEVTSDGTETVPTDQDNQPVQLVRAGYHPLAALKRVPLQRFCLSKGWWLGNRAYLAAMEHVNVSNSLKWSLFMAAHAVPIVFTDDEVTTVQSGETGFLKFGADAKYQFAEPTGSCWEHLAKRADVLKQEIYRMLYLMAQARNTSATAQEQSGYSKEQDMKPSHDVLNAVGDVLRAGIQCVLENVAAARALLVPGTDSDKLLLFDVRGFQFSEDLGTEDVDKLTGLYALRVPSKRFEKELDKQLAVAALPDMNPEVKEEIFAEIEAAPSRDELEQQRKDEDAERMRKSLDAAADA